LNRLARETSPYLLQHASNPVDWHPWGEEAFEKARREDKPVFLSIGYSTCHWCHVMARESFEDPDVARLLNDAFVPVKVDREERPDIDHVYVAVCQLMTGTAGWPLTIIMTPDGKPFFAGTYIPRQGRSGAVGLLELVPRIKGLWASRREKALGVGDEVAAVLARGPGAPGPAALGAPVAPVDFAEILDQGYAGLAEAFDEEHGGFGGAPKFPSPHNLLFLLRYWRRTGRAEALAMVEQTLWAMRAGGIFDHLGLGFHRYSTDEAWRVPHFEKMLYDQALLAMAYTEAAQATGKAEYAEVAREIITYVLRDLTSEEGAFYSAEDADSEGEEGRFYVWRADEIRQALGGTDAAVFARAYNVEETGNAGGHAAGLPPGANVLYFSPLATDAASDSCRDPLRAEGELAALRQKLFAWRAGRQRPRRDDKILTDWNGLMIAALAKAGRALDEPQYMEAARRAADYALSHLRAGDGRLLHVWSAGRARLAGNLDDYVFLAWGLLEVYQATFDAKYLKVALDISRTMVAHFSDPAGAGYYFSADDGEQLLVRQKQVYDGAVPSGNSAALLNLARLARLTGDQSLEAEAVRQAAWLARLAARSPLTHVHALVGLDFAAGPSQEVVVAGAAGGTDTRAMLLALATRFLPRAVVILIPTDEATPEIKRLAPFTERYTSLEGRSAAYVCRDFTCALPTTDSMKMLGELGESER
jgi:uncharacterized protein YyaL (SSP411 family)